MIRTKSGLPKYCSWNTDRHGRRRVRFRKNGFSTYLPGIPWAEDFMRAYAAALEGVLRRRPTSAPGAPFRDRSTRSSSRTIVRRNFAGSKQVRRRFGATSSRAFRREHGGKPLKGLKRAHVKSIIGAKADTPESANNLLKVLRLLLAYAVEAEMIESNPAIGVKRYKSRGDGFHAWSETRSRGSSRTIRSAQSRG